MDGPHYGAPPGMGYGGMGYNGMGYGGMMGYGQNKERGFLSKLFGNRSPRHDMVGAVPMEMNFGHEWNPMPRDYGLQDLAPRGYGFEMPRRRDFSPGRAWMAHRARDFDEFDDVDLEMPRRRDHLMDDLDLMVSRRDPLRDIPRRDPIDMMLERNDQPSPPPLPPMRSEPAPRRDYRRPMSVGAQINQDNANKGWVQGKDMRKGTFDLPRIKSDVVMKPKYKFNSPEHQYHVKRNVNALEIQNQLNAERNRREQEQEEEERRRKQNERERYDDRRGRGDGGRGRRGRRGRDGGYSSEEYDDDNDNPYHHLPTHHIPHDEYDNAVRRNLHAWSQWRTDMNDRRGRETRVNLIDYSLQNFP